MSALEALQAAHAAGLRLAVSGEWLDYAAPKEPSTAVIAMLKRHKLEVMRLLAVRDAAEVAEKASAPPDCSPQQWQAAVEGARRFVADGWSDKAALMGWTADELYRAPPVWSRIDLCGVALLIGDRRVVAVTEASIVIETPSGSRLRFRRLGREHLA